MSNKPHSREKKISNTSIKVKKKSVDNKTKKSSSTKGFLNSLIKK